MLQTTTQLPFSVKLFSASSPPPKKPSTRDREYLRSPEVKAMIRAAKKANKVQQKALNLEFPLLITA